MKKEKLCEFGNYIKNGMEVKLLCEHTGNSCSYIRWCLTDSCLVMNEKYLNCRGRNKVKDKELIEENNEKKESTTKKQIKSPKSKKETCNVLWSKPNKIAFDFKGNGISQYTKENFANTKTVEVEYTGEIGKKNFNIINIK